MRKLKKVLSLALALVMCLGLTVPAFAEESKWKLEVPGKTDAQVFVGAKTFTLRDCGVYDYDPSIGETVLYKEDDLQWTAENVCVLAKGDTAVFTYTYKSKESTDDQLFYGSAYSGEDFNLMAWSDPDGDGVYDKRTIEINFSDEDDSSYGENGYADLLPENKYKALPVGSVWTGHPWSAHVSCDEEGRHEVRLSADRVLELLGPNTLVGIYNSNMSASDPADMDWFILVEGDATQPQQPAGTTASPTNDKLEVNGNAADPTVYKIGDSNYFKIRDVAALLNGTEKQFAVGYDGSKNAVTATTGQGYDKQSGDLTGAPAGGSQTADPSNDAIYVNGEKIAVEVYKINGSNYFKLRDLGKALNFYVGWSADRGMYIETNKPYSE